MKDVGMYFGQEQPYGFAKNVRTLTQQSKFKCIKIITLITLRKVTITFTQAVKKKYAQPFSLLKLDSHDYH